MARRGSALAVAVTVLCLASCAGDDDPATAPTLPPTAPPTTSRIPVTAEPTSPPPTTEAPTATTTPAQDLAAEVEADLLEAFRLGREASMDPFNAGKEQAALDRRLGMIAQSLSNSLADLRSKNYAIRPNPNVTASVVVESPPRFVGAESRVAEVQICEVNSWLLVEVGAGPNGTDAVVDPDVVSSRATIFMRNVDDVWRFEGSDLIEEWFGAEECASQ
jgi:hypothetical protein